MSEQEQKPGNGLAVTALIFSCLMCVPLFPLIGVILGMVALVRIRRNPASGGLVLAIVALAVGSVGTFVSAGIGAAVAIPAYVKFLRRTKTAEALDSLDRLVTSAHSAAQANGAAGSQPVPSAPLTPPYRCCERFPQGRCELDPALWQQPGWQALGFVPPDPHSYQYEVVSDGRNFTVRALGDLDCDGILSTFERSGQIDAQGQLVGAGGVRRDQEYE